MLKQLLVFFSLIFLGCLIPGPNSAWAQGNTAYSDSAKQAYNDSIAAVRSYMKSKAYNDSLDMVRKQRMDSIRHHQDSVKRENERLRDSTKAALAEAQYQRQLEIDAIKREKQVFIDSLNEVKKYRSSKRYRDSVQQEKDARIDSLRRERQAYVDSMKSERQRQMDSMKQVLKVRNDSLQVALQAKNDSLQAFVDSLKSAQKVFRDSLEVVKQNRIDSLQKLKEEREDRQYELEKKRKKDKRDKDLEKIQKERDRYTNDLLMKKKWSLRRRVFQNTVTRYNYFFNATNKIKEAEKNMYISRIDNFDSLLTLYPYDPLRDGAVFQNDMDTLAKRLAIGIQIHDPRSKWQDDLYLLLGKSFYYKGAFSDAATAFEYVMNYDKKYPIKKQKKKKKSGGADKAKEAGSVLNLDGDKTGMNGLFQHKMAKNEAALWLSKSYIKLGEYDRAQILLDMVLLDKNANDELKAGALEAYAFLHLERNEKQAALTYLDTISTIRYIDKRLRQRSAFLAGQLYFDNNEWENADRMYGVVAGLNAPVELDLNANLNSIIAQTHLSGDSGYDEIHRRLRIMAREDKYKQYYDRINMSLAQSYSHAGQVDNALESYRKTVLLAGNNPHLKGQAFYEMGDLHYSNKNYVSAQQSYDSALIFLDAGLKPEEVALVTKKSQNLQIISVPAAQVQYADSILMLTRMTDREKTEWAKRQVRKYNEEQRIRAMGTAGPAAGGMGTSGAFYFTNPEQVKKGQEDFKSQWGDRPLVDNWRRSTEIKVVNTGNAEEDTEVQPERVDEKYFIAQIPTDPAIIDSIKNKLESQYIELEKAYYITENYSDIKALYQDFSLSYPNSQRYDVFYYDLYFVYLRENNLDSAQHYKDRLAAEYPGSEGNRLISQMSTSPADAAVDYREIEAHLDQTYKMLNDGMFTDVIVRTEEVRKQYPVQVARYQSQYNLMKAIAFGGMGEMSKADTLLTEFINSTPNDTLKKWAQDVLNYLQQTADAEEKPEAAGGSTVSFLSPTIGMDEYALNKSEKHYVIIYISEFDNRIMPLRAGISDFNTFAKSEAELKTSFSDLRDKERMIVIKDFANDAQAKKYITDLQKEKELFKGYNVAADMKILVISESNFLILSAQKDFVKYLTFFNQKY